MSMLFNCGLVGCLFACFVLGAVRVVYLVTSLCVDLVGLSLGLVFVYVVCLWCCF